ncbi:uncharacterized protein LOC111715006 [Eurytemora carolleeae]|uniref:uncharacterized protein LOC111715006 n=1 Tax=Eurytemora carolleeae TaxID=1294199 RepID=UPI000C78AE47|nr:uncharacterized protein LOC111715006 [Eurytemora carolleeae]|eukprot:XP_023346008.1 uncharacterized protein LOC111715006 [Eurytemora affinis]
MSHISEFLKQVRRSPPPRRGNIPSAWDCFTTASKTAKVYRSMGRSVNRRVFYTADLIASNEELEFPHTKSFIAGTSWSVYKVSPLWNLKYQEQKKKSADDTDYNLEEKERLLYDQKALKRYAAVIQSFLPADSSVADIYKVEISTLQGLRGSRNDKDALMIEVRVCWDDQDRIIFNGVLCGIETSELMIKSANATSLPVLLTSGNVDTVERSKETEGSVQ